MAGPRITAAVGTDYARLRFLAYRTEGGAPIIAIGVHTVISISVILLFDDVGMIVEYAGLTLSMLGMAAIGGVFILRIREPELERTYRVPGYPYIPLIALVISAWMLVASVQYKPESLGVSLATLALGPLTWFLVRNRV